MTACSKRSAKRYAGAAAFAAFWALIAAAPRGFGEPPAWELAQGWRVKHEEPFYLGYGGRKWERDFGVLDGRCNRQAAGAALGGAAGGMAGAQAARSPERQIATVQGAILLGVPTTDGIGHDMDPKDRACLGQALELAGAERDVTWTNAQSGVAYSVIPLGGFTDNGRSCREFVTFVASAGRPQATVRHKACSGGDGVWQIIG